jgi:hypothetical protein
MSAVSPAADRVAEATEAASRVAAQVGADTSGFEVLNKSNNVVVRFADIVLKVSTHVAMAERDVIVASHANANRGHRTGLASRAPVSPAADGDHVLHTEPHNGNQLTRDGRVVFIDFEAAAIGPSSGTSPSVPTTSPTISGRTTTSSFGRR